MKLSGDGGLWCSIRIVASLLTLCFLTQFLCIDTAWPSHDYISVNFVVAAKSKLLMKVQRILYKTVNESAANIL